MAIFYPSLEKISMFKVPATVGEWTLLEFLKNCLDDSFVFQSIFKWRQT